MQKHSASAFFHISITNLTTSPFPVTPTPHPCPTITILIHQNSHLFRQPTTLPPPRPINHQIHLLPNTQLVNIRHYRYPHFQKIEIKKQVNEMSTSSIIQLSHSSFSSLVLLVKKKDDSWQFCVDYRALNPFTVKDHFPMLTID